MDTKETLQLVDDRYLMAAVIAAQMQALRLIYAALPENQRSNIAGALQAFCQKAEDFNARLREADEIAKIEAAMVKAAHTVSRSILDTEDWVEQFHPEA